MPLVESVLDSGGHKEALETGDDLLVGLKVRRPTCLEEGSYLLVGGRGRGRAAEWMRRNRHGVLGGQTRVGLNGFD